jgi:FHS family glucose/mannose:H+ symporter-like MFS transporter
MALSIGDFMHRCFATSVIFIGFFLFGMVFILWGVLLPDIAKSLTMSELVSGIFFSLISVGAIVGAFLGGKYIQKFDFMSLFACLSFLLAVLLFVMSSVTHWSWLVVSAFVLGLICSSLFTIGHTMIARLYVERRSKMMGFMDFMFSLGTLAAPFYISALYLFEHDWRWPLRWLAMAIILLSAYSWYVALKGKKLAPIGISAARKSLSYRNIIKQPVFLLLALAALGYGAVEFGNGNWFVSYAQQGRGFGGEDARFIFAFFTGGMAISRLGFSFLLAWFSHHRLMLILGSVMVAGTFIIKLAVEPQLMSFGNFLVGLGLGGLFPLMLSSAMDLDSDNGPLISGVCVIGSSVGVQLASFGTGVWASFAPLTTAFWVIPISALWLWAMVWGYSRRIKSAASA